MENWRRQRLLENLKQLLRLSTYRNGIGQVVYALLEFTWVRVKHRLEKKKKSHTTSDKTNINRALVVLPNSVFYIVLHCVPSTRSQLWFYVNKH